MRDPVPKICRHDILQTACENFTKFTTVVQLGTEMNGLDFEIKKSKVKVVTRTEKKSLVLKRSFPADAYLLTVHCRGPSSFLNVPFFLLPSQMCHCFEM